MEAQCTSRICLMLGQHFLLFPRLTDLNSKIALSSISDSFHEVTQC